MPDARIARDEGVCWLGEALAAPGFHLLLCGRLSDRDARQLVAVREVVPVSVELEVAVPA